jgi:choline dehydrogenase-like flavoprotein
VPVADAVARHLPAAPEVVQRLVRLSLRLLDVPGPRRFSSLGVDARVRRLERLDRRRIGHDLVLLLKALVSVAYAGDPRVRAAVGSEPECLQPDRPAGSEPPRLDPAAMAAPAGEEERCDVVVVGSGAGGAVAARVLAEAGLSVVVVEEGDYHDAASYPDAPLDALRLLYRDGGLLAAEGRPAIPLPVGRCVGGTTVINSGTCFRAPDWVLQRWRAEHGIDWAAELDGDFDAVEKALRVTAVDPARCGRNGELCRTGAEALGASNGPILRNAPGPVTRCNACAMGCRLDAKQAMHVSELPRAVAAGARIRAGARADRLIVERGRAAGMECTLGSGQQYAVRARAVVLAGGAVGTPELLLRNRVANASGAVGRHLHIHPACWVGARYPEPVRGWEGVMQSWSVDEWRREDGLFLEATFSPLPFGMPWLRGVGPEFTARVERYGELGIIGVHLGERTSEGRVTLRGGRTRVSYGLTRDDAAVLRRGIARAAEVHFAAGATEAYPQVRGVDELAPGAQHALETGRFSPADMRLEAFHPMGTARMGADARSSVVSPSGEAHDLPGLHVADASVLPTALSVNPMVTIMACARHIARGLAERLAG